MSAYYNEIDPNAGAWLRALIADGRIADGDVDDRDIRDVRPDDLRGYRQCHFFAGIGGWSLALRLAGVSDDTPVWTGSCPCQPFSAAGRRAGCADERHLWPAFHWLIDQCRPATLFGEQVASHAPWVDLVLTDLEALGYAVGAGDLPAASVGAPHIRQRAWFVAHTKRGAPERHGLAVGRTARGAEGATQERERLRSDAGDGGHLGLVAHTDQRARGQRRALDGVLQRGGGHLQQPEDAPAGFWDAADWLPCRDGKLRPVEPGAFPLAHGIPARVGRLRGYGNAIVPHVAAAFIRAAVQGVEP
jgi:DNA (cytosine-5)-methyltransferase 1